MQVYLTGLAISLLFAYLYRAYNNSAQKNIVIETSKYVRENPKKRNKLTAIFIASLSALPLMAISAVRFGVGTDYFSAYFYSYQYHRFDGKGFYQGEFLYNFFEAALSFLQAPEILVFVASSIFIGALYYYAFFKYSVNPEYSIFLYIGTNIYFLSLNAVRQGMAMAIIFIAIQYLKENKTRIYVVLIILAMGFHRSAIIMLIIYFLSKIRISVSRSIGVLMLTVVSGSLLGRLIREIINLTRYADYYGSMFDSNEFDFANTAIQVAVLLIYSFYLENAKQTKYAKEFSIYYWMQMIAVFFIFSSTTIPLAKRICWYMTVNQLMAIPIISKIEESMMVKYILNVGIILFFALSIYFGVVVNGAHDVLPYRTIWEAYDAISNSPGL